MKILILLLSITSFLYANKSDEIKEAKTSLDIVFNKEINRLIKESEQLQAIELGLKDQESKKLKIFTELYPEFIAADNDTKFKELRRKNTELMKNEEYSKAESQKKKLLGNRINIMKELSPVFQKAYEEYYDLVHANKKSKNQPSDGLRLSSEIQSNMVIQQGKPFKIWGLSTDKSRITIQSSWHETITVDVSSDGKFSTEIPVPYIEAGDFTKQTIQINDKIFTNILIGDVWLCGGQSNMEMTMQPALPWHEGVINFKEEIKAANFPNIRFLYVQRNYEPSDYCEGKWKEISSNTAHEMSGVGYFFARKIYQTLNIPIGIVVSAHGGASCQTFVPEKDLFNDPFLRKHYYDAMLNKNNPRFEPSVLYRSMINPLKRISLRGILWYQGESNVNDGEKYIPLKKALITAWRREFNQPELPFYFVQLAPFNYGTKNNVFQPFKGKSGFFRVAQEQVTHQVENTAMAVTIDNPEIDTIHPSNKQDVGYRLALIALNRTYNYKDVIHQGPKMKDVIYDGEDITITYEPNTIGGGLVTNDGNAPRHFYVAGDDKVFYKADAEIANNTIKLKSPVSSPRAVRYAMLTYNVTNLSNKEGLPAFIFRTDNWNNATYSEE